MAAAPASKSPPIPKSTFPAAEAGAEVAPEAAAVLAVEGLAVEAPVEAPVFRAVEAAEVDMLIEPVELAAVVVAAAVAPETRGSWETTAKLAVSIPFEMVEYVVHIETAGVVAGPAGVTS